MTTPHAPKRYRPAIRVFVSSTFSDLVHERNALQERVWPELERYCLLRGFQFQAIDLRWGVPTEAGLDHRTMRICFDELQRAQEVSPRPNFLILLGDRYGWQPLPEAITPDEFAALRDDAATRDVGDARILDDWYRLDTNARPALHLLRSRRESPDGRDYTQDAEGRDTAAWTEVQNVLWSLINRVFPPEKLAGRFAEPIAPDRPVPTIVRFQGSATEQEIWHGAFAVADAPRHVIAFSRDIARQNIDSLAGHAGLRDYVNLAPSGQLDRNLHEAVRALKTQLKGKLGENYIETPQPATLRTVRDAGNDPSLGISTDHLDFLCGQVRDRLLPIIEQQIEEHNRAPEPGTGVTLSGETLRDLQREREQHARFALERAPAGVFVGREAEQNQILVYLTSDHDRPFILHGVSGSGKSALMAAAARQAAAGSGAILIERYLGTTKRSSDLRSLLIDLCLSLREHFALTDELPTDIRLLEKEFYEQLRNATAKRPVHVFLDALDQLDPGDDAHRLWWIRSTPLPPHARLVVSCLSDPEDETASGPWNALNQRGLSRPDNSVGIEHLEPEEAKLLWTRWLDQAQRNLSDEQQAAVDDRILQGSAACRQPLYLRILFEEARRWPSLATPPPLGATVPELLASLFDRLSQPAAHGPLVEPALGYLVSSRYGLAESELLESLLRDPDYKRQLLASAQHALPRHANRIPIAIWSRLRYDLAPYLSERGAPGGSVLHFCHRQVGACVRERFAGTPARRYQWHRRLALYFARQQWWLESRAKQRERAKPPYSTRPAHVRKITELPDHLLSLAREAHAAGLEAETKEAFQWIERLFQKLPFLEAKNEAGRVFELAGDFSRALDTLPEDRPQRRIVKLLDEALRRDIHFIARHTDDYPQALFQCLWNNGWWYDCDEAASHYENGRSPGLASPEGGGGTARNGVADTVPDDRRLCHLLEHGRERREQATPGFAWLRSLRPPPIHLGTAQLAVLRGHEGPVKSIAYSPDGQRIVSGSSDKMVRVWDVLSGAELAIMRGHEDYVNSVTFSSDGQHILSGSEDRTVRVWDAERCTALMVLRGHEDAVESATYSLDGQRIISGGGWKDKTVRMWDAQSGAQLAALRGHESVVMSVSYSPDGRRIISGGGDKTVRVWDAQSGAQLAVLRGHESAVWSVSYSPDGQRIVSGDGSPLRHDATVRVWDAETGGVLTVLRGHNDVINSVAFSSSGNRIISGSGSDYASAIPGLGDHTIRVWSAHGGTDSAVLHGHEGFVLDVVYSPTGHRISSGSCDKTVRIWDGDSGEQIRVLRGHEKYVKSVVYSRDGRRIVSDSFDATVRVWDAVDGNELAILRGHEGVRSTACSPDGRRIVTSGSGFHWDYTMRLWDAESGTELAILRRHEEGPVERVVFSSDGQRVISGGGWKDKTVRIWDARSGAQLAVLRGHKSDVLAVDFSTNGTRIVSGSSDSTVRLWDASTGEELAVLHGHERAVHDVVFSSDGRRIVSEGDNTIRVWDVQSGKCLEVIQGDGDVRAIAAGLPWRALARGLEIVIETVETGAEIARFPIVFEHMRTHPSARTWIGSDVNHLYIITLEG